MKGFTASRSNEERDEWMIDKISLLRHRYYEIMERFTSDPTEQEKLYFQVLVCMLMRMSFLSDVEQRFELGKLLLSHLGETVEEIESSLFPSKKIDGSSEEVEQDFVILLSFKAMYLIENQKIEEGITLLNSMIKTTKSSFQGAIKWRIESRFHEDFIDTKKIRNGIYQGQDQVNLSFPKSIEERPSSDEGAAFRLEDPSSEKHRILKEAEQILQHHLLKKEKKQTRIASSVPVATTKAPLHAQKAKETLVSSPQEIKKEILITKDQMEIFERLWQEKTPSNDSWDIRSFRNDIKMTRIEALTLIEALGGRYLPTRGKGSHHVAHLPKIEFNGEDMGGLVDWETGEMMITLTNDKILKHYQIRQLRNILLKQGFNPDIVKVKS